MPEASLADTRLQGMNDFVDYLRMKYDFKTNCGENPAAHGLRHILPWEKGSDRAISLTESPGDKTEQTAGEEAEQGEHVHYDLTQDQYVIQRLHSQHIQAVSTITLKDMVDPEKLEDENGPAYVTIDYKSVPAIGSVDESSVEYAVWQAMCAIQSLLNTAQTVVTKRHIEGSDHTDMNWKTFCENSRKKKTKYSDKIRTKRDQQYQLDMSTVARGMSRVL